MICLKNTKMNWKCLIFQVDEQIGELFIHCKYGCRSLPNGIPGKYEVDPQGMTGQEGVCIDRLLHILAIERDCPRIIIENPFENLLK